MWFIIESRGFYQYADGDVKKVLEAASLVTPLNLEPLKFEQNQYALFIWEIFSGGENLTFSAEGLPNSLSLKIARVKLQAV